MGTPAPAGPDIFARPDESELPSDVLDAFRAESFAWGAVPQIEPPRSLCT